MRPNFPSQIAQRLAAPFQGCWGLLRIVASCGLCAGSGWRSPLGRHTSRRREEALRGRNGLPSLAAYKDIVGRASLSRAASHGEAAVLFVDTKAVCRGSRYAIPPCGLTAVALNLFDGDRGHAVTCNRLFR